MAEYQYTIYSSKSAYVDVTNPGQNFSTGEIGLVDGGKYGFEYFATPAAAIGKRVVSLQLHLYTKVTETAFNDGGTLSIESCREAWDENLINYRNQPNTNHCGYIDVIKESTFAWKTINCVLSGNYGGGVLNALAFGLRIAGSNATAQYYNCRSSNKPYITLVCEDVTPTVKNANPQSGFIDDAGSPQFSFALSYDASYVISGNYIAEVEFRYRAATSGEYQTITVTPAELTWTGMNYWPPNSIFPAMGTFQWQVRLKSTGGIWSEPTPWYTLTTTDSTMYAYPRSPVNAYVDGSEVVVLDWSREISTGTTPKGADFQTSTNNGVSWNDLGSVVGYQTYNAPVGTLPAGSILWRVRGYNSDNVAGPWSDGVSIIVKAAPPTPSISSVTTTSRPTIQWQATGQQAFQVISGDYDSGIVFGIARSFQIPVFLPDGLIEIKIRVQNSLGLWSQWAAASVEISNTPGAAIELQHTAKSFGIWLKWETAGTYSSYIIYRDGVRIAEVTQMQYTDYLSNGKHSYMVRGLYGDNYTLSNAITEILRPVYGAIAVLGSYDWIPLKYRRGAMPMHGNTTRPDISLVYYSGRKKPVAEVSEFQSSEHTFSFSVKPCERYIVDAVRGMVGQPVVYKDNIGDIAIGILTVIESSGDRAIDFSITIAEVDGYEL